ncbi:hypothetical protein T492DRAFT_91041 [Pavlovales sp. CCMP2436]|nr:hypothetical protein T492DRAFT_91041 [Pavlovales sp. CCMP2436]
MSDYHNILIIRFILLLYCCRQGTEGSVARAAHGRRAGPSARHVRAAALEQHGGRRRGDGQPLGQAQGRGRGRLAPREAS